MRQYSEMIHDDLGNKISDYLTGAELSNFASVSKSNHKLFEKPLNKRRTQQLLSAVFMGNELLARHILETNPEILFEKGNYQLPIFSADGNKLEQSEQTYYDVTPLELSLYTGDWSMWKYGILCVRELSRNQVFAQKIINAMRLVQQGGPDLVKINREYSLNDLERFRQDVGGFTINSPLLSNPDGIICQKIGVQYSFFYVNKQAQTIEAITPDLRDPADAANFELLIHKVEHEMPANSSIRTSDQEHALIATVFKKQLVRNGIHYQLNGVHFHDTHDGSYRLQNAYAKYYELAREGNATHEQCMNIIGKAQRNAMPYDIQLMLDTHQYGDDLADRDILRLSQCQRDNTFSALGEETPAYPLKDKAGIGFDYVLSRASLRRAPSSRAIRHAGERPLRKTSSCMGNMIIQRPVTAEFAECNQIANIKIDILNQLLQQLEENARPRSETSTSCGMGFFQFRTLGQIWNRPNHGATETTQTIEQIAAQFSSPG